MKKVKYRAKSGRPTTSHLVPSNSSFAGFFACNAAGFLGFGGVLAPTFEGLVKALGRGNARTRTRRDSHSPSQCRVLVCHFGRMDPFQSLGDIGTLVDFSKDGSRSYRRGWGYRRRRAWRRRRRRRRRSGGRSAIGRTVHFEICNRPALYRTNEPHNMTW